MMIRRLLAATLALACTAGPALADRLSEIVARGEIRLGVRADSPPFSIAGAGGTFSGYQVDMCRAVVDEIARASGKTIAVKHVIVDAGNRFRMLSANHVDLLCEPSTVTLERRERVDFSLPTFVTGAGIMGRLAPSPVSLPPLGGNGVGIPANPPRRLGVLSGTTTEHIVKELVTKGLLNAQIIDVATHGDGITALSAGLLDGYAADLEILVDLRSRIPNPETYVIADRLLSLETYAIAMKRGESALRLAADRAIAQLYRGGGIREIAERNFPGRAPGDVFAAMVLLNAIMAE